MKLFTRLGAQALFVLAAFGVMASDARADLIRIDDLREGPLVVTSSVQSSITDLISRDEYVSFTYSSPEINSGSFIAYLDLLEDDGSLSDRFIITSRKGSNQLDVVFGSDPEIPPIPQSTPELPVVNLGTFFETGDWQTVIQTANHTFQVRSDVTPEPSTVTLLGIGGFGVVGAWWRKRRLVSQLA